MTKPVRLQLSRRRGFNLQEHSRAVNGLEAVNCARPGRRGNPFRVGDFGIRTNADAKQRFGQWLDGRVTGPEPPTRENINDLRGKNLACYCKLCGFHSFGGKRLDTPCPDCAPCHCDVLGEIANTDPTPRPNPAAPTHSGQGKNQ